MPSPSGPVRSGQSLSVAVGMGTRTGTGTGTGMGGRMIEEEDDQGMRGLLVTSPPRKLTREVSSNFGPTMHSTPARKDGASTGADEGEEGLRSVRSGEILLAPEGEEIPTLQKKEESDPLKLSSAGTTPATVGKGNAARYWKVDKIMGEGAFSLVWSAKEVIKRKKTTSNLLVPITSNGEQEEYEEKGDEVVAIKMMDKRMCRENDRTRISFVREVAVLRVSSAVQLRRVPLY
jgi:hypothetical protein